MQPPLRSPISVKKRLGLASGKELKLAIILTGELVDTYGRMLAYLAPWHKKPLPQEGSPKRATFNLNMIEGGWGSFFPIYPSFPRKADFDRAIKAAEIAWTKKIGQWKFGANLLLAYEYRMCIKLAGEGKAKKLIADAFQRHCYDLKNKKLVGKYDFWKVGPPNRMWIWDADLKHATVDLGIK